MTDRNRGEWLQTYGGRAFYPNDPRPEDININDIAHSLARICRFNGHIRGDWYSVAQHGVLVAQAIEAWGGTPDEVFAGLNHDDGEAYLGDVIWPLKCSARMAGYREMEREAEAVVAARFAIADLMPPIVKRADLVVLATEKRDIVNGSVHAVGLEVAAAREQLGAWHCDTFEPLGQRIVGLPPREAEALFLESFAKYDEARRK